MGNLIQIYGNNGSQFLNTNTGKIETLSINAPTYETGKIEFKQISDFNSLLTIENDKQLSLTQVENNLIKKIKKLKSND